MLKVPLIPLLCYVGVVLLATLQSPTRGEEFSIEEEVIAEEENEVLPVFDKLTLQKCTPATKKESEK